MRFLHTRLLSGSAAIIPAVRGGGVADHVNDGFWGAPMNHIKQATVTTATTATNNNVMRESPDDDPPLIGNNNELPCVLQRAGPPPTPPTIPLRFNIWCTYHTHVRMICMRGRRQQQHTRHLLPKEHGSPFFLCRLITYYLLRSIACLLLRGVSFIITFSAYYFEILYSKTHVFILLLRFAVYQTLLCPLQVGERHQQTKHKSIEKICSE